MFSLISSIIFSFVRSLSLSGSSNNNAFFKLEFFLGNDLEKKSFNFMVILLFNLL